MLGQTSQLYAGSAVALIPRYIAVNNSISSLVDDGFIQRNPCAVDTQGTVSRKIDPRIRGVLSGSVAFVRPDAGNDWNGGPGDADIQAKIQANPTWAACYRPMGVYINTAIGNNAYDNQGTPGSGILTYVSSGGTYQLSLFETQLLIDLDIAEAPAKADIMYVSGTELVSSRNGLVMPRYVTGKAGKRLNVDEVVGLTAESYVRLNLALTAANLFEIIKRGGPSTTIGVVKMVPDAGRDFLIYDQRL